MKIAIIGANGKQGSLLVKEALGRGHDVIAIVKGESQVTQAGAKVLVKDLFDLAYEDIAENEVVISAFGTWTPETIPQIVTATNHLCDVLSGKANRFLMVGGAGGLYVNPEHTVMLIDTPEFPEMFKLLAATHNEALANLRGRNDVRWTSLSPAADFKADGERTGKYKLGGEELILSGKGESQISYADYAIAMIDEAEKGKHINARFSVVAE